MRSGGACVWAGTIERSKRVNVGSRGEGRQVWVSLGVNRLDRGQESWSHAGQWGGKVLSGKWEHWALSSSCPGLWERISRHPCSASDQPVPGE